MSARPPEVHLTLPAVPESVMLVRQVVSGLADAGGWSADMTADVKLAVSEACTNVVVHAYGEEAGDLEFLAWVDDERLTTEIRDRGRGMTPAVGVTSGGLGIGVPLMVALSDGLRLRSSDELTSVEMEFPIERDDGAGAREGR